MRAFAYTVLEYSSIIILVLQLSEISNVWVMCEYLFSSFLLTSFCLLGFNSFREFLFIAVELFQQCSCITITK